MKVVLNRDKELVNEIRKKLKENKGYCPCKISHDDNNKCMCDEFIQSKELGECHCGLYIKTQL